MTNLPGDEVSHFVSRSRCSSTKSPFVRVDHRKFANLWPAQPEFTTIMGNSPSYGQGGSEAHDSRDIDGTEFKDGRPPEFTKRGEI